MSDDIIGKSLGIAPIKVEIVDEPMRHEIVKYDDPEERATADFNYARDNFYNVIEKGTDALEQMLNVAKASEHPRAYEVVSTIMKTLIDANKDLVAMSEKKSSPKSEDSANKGPVTNNNLFVGSTAELQAVLKDLRNDKQQ